MYHRCGEAKLRWVGLAADILAPENSPAVAWNVAQLGLNSVSVYNCATRSQATVGKKTLRSTMHKT